MYKKAERPFDVRLDLDKDRNDSFNGYLSLIVLEETGCMVSFPKNAFELVSTASQQKMLIMGLFFN